MPSETTVNLKGFTDLFHKLRYYVEIQADSYDVRMLSQTDLSKLGETELKIAERLLCGSYESIDRIFKEFDTIYQNMNTLQAYAEIPTSAELKREARQRAKVRNIIFGARAISRSELLRYSHLKASELDKAVKHLCWRGDIEISQSTSETCKRNVWYTWINIYRREAIEKEKAEKLLRNEQAKV